MQEPAHELHDREEQLEKLQKQIKEWEDMDKQVSPKDDEYKLTLHTNTVPITFKFRAKNKFQAVRKAMNLFEGLEVWQRACLSFLKLETLDCDGGVLSEVIFLSNE